ncbi:hypothetical protein MTsPCn5_23350 [Croceitalea sp. MTPC5]|uniref:hypothetical protein n=1 Tax=Croceitalea sp. MTPC5 TaxID=3056565 RepID=UPI002B38287F|nr:hypothetical protein MTsPCn5_23350 [Croceitalea sp. MTPC5]
MTRLCCILLFVMLQACAQQTWHGNLSYSGRLPSNLSEVSGIVSYDGSTAWVIEDNGNKDYIYRINLEGKLIKKFKVKNAKNKDWEDLTRDQKGNLYIGDFGNNYNDRKNLTIYKLPNPEVEKGDKIEAEEIGFRYPEQKKFPPKKKGLLYDSEAFFHWKDHLYIFTKDRSRPYLGKTLIYKIPDEKGEYDAKLVGSLNLCSNQDHCSITGAAISDDGKTIALIGYGYLYTATNVDLNHLSDTQFKTTDLNYNTQIESVCFINDSTLLIADEQSKSKGRNLYRFILN